MRVLVAPDKFKGTLTAVEAGEAIADGWGRQRPQDSVSVFPISDGGDGFGELLARHLEARPEIAATVNAAGQPIDAVWWWEPRKRLAIVESARVVGLAMLPPGKYHPFDLDTFGLGAVLDAVADKRPRACLLGIGGSATNDGGFGLLRSLGWQFRDRRQQPIERWTDLWRLETIEPPSQRPRLADLRVAVDVTNPLLGVRGATRVYGPQKGVRLDDVPLAERCLRRLARAMAGLGNSRQRLHRSKGAGAAGGLGYGLLASRIGRLEPGFALYAAFADLRSRLEAADLVITGEGALDRTTLAMGKGVGQLADLCGRMRRPCLVLAGTVLAKTPPRQFARTYAIAPDLASAKEAMARPVHWLKRLASIAAHDWTVIQGDVNDAAPGQGTRPTRL